LRAQWRHADECTSRPCIRRPRPAGGYVLAIAGAVLAVFVAALTERWLGLTICRWCSCSPYSSSPSRTHTGPAVLTAVLCFPRLQLLLHRPALHAVHQRLAGRGHGALFLAAALLAGRMAATLAMQVQALARRQSACAGATGIGATPGVAADEAAVIEAAHATFRQGLEADVWVRLDEPASVANGAHDTARETVEEHGWWFLPLRAPHGTLGMIGLKRADTCGAPG
jgi:two-component system sensor histidine kinase KdpD